MMSAPCFEISFISRCTAFSFPGMGDDENSTTSFVVTVTFLWDPDAALESAAMDSPCEPVMMITVLLSG